MAGLFVGIAALPATAVSPTTDADALARKFIEGPGNEAKSTGVERPLEQLRLKELDALSAKLRKARKQHPEQTHQKQSQKPHDQPSSSGLRGFSNYGTPADRARREVARKTEQQRVAVLLAMQPGRRGARRFAGSAEPIICFEAQCFIAAGPGQRAVAMPRRKALGPSNAVAARAGACRYMPRCVFRNVPLSPTRAWLQPVDLGWIRHDRREPVAIAADPTCRVEKQRLICERVVKGPDYRLWLVPEDVARQAGSDLLQKALAGGLRPIKRQAVLDRS